MTAAPSVADALNAICPYFTMFPLDFPRDILERHARKGQRVLDPFCGRGTTNFAARLAGLDSLGVDSSPVAAAITASKLANTNVGAVVRAARQILVSEAIEPVPRGRFWEHAYHPKVLRALAKLRKGLLADCRSEARKFLRGVVLGALHGPRTKSLPSYFSNQCTRTFAPKPAYAVRYWRAHKEVAPDVDVLDLIRRRAERFLNVPLPRCEGRARLGDSRDPLVVDAGAEMFEFDWVITSPPYYGMRTYVQDQWLRHWFVGGPDRVDYSVTGQLSHLTPDSFTRQLTKVWNNVAQVCSAGARLVVRFGGIRDRKADPLDLIKSTLRESVWRVSTIREAGMATAGRRQADTFLMNSSVPMREYDVWARLA